MTAPLTDRASAVYRLAELVHREEIPPESEPVLFDAVKVIVGRDPKEFWTDLLDALERRDEVEDMIAPQFRASQLEIVNDEIARSLWALVWPPRLERRS